MRILVVEDEKHLNRIISEAVEDEGYSVDSCYNGVEALEYLECADYDVIILDIMMPGLDGIQTTEILRRTHNIPVIMLSAKSEDIDKIDGLTAGADDYMTKPFQPAELIARVKSPWMFSASILQASSVDG